MASEKRSTASTKANAKKSTSTTRKTTKTSASARTAASGKKSTGSGQTKNSAAKKDMPVRQTKTDNKKTSEQITLSDETSRLEYERLCEKERMFKNEIAILITFAVALFLFFSNFHWCGSVGEVFFRIMCGSMGVMGYAFPVYVIIIACFIVRKNRSFKPAYKAIAGFLIYWVLCGLAELFFGGEFNPGYAIADYFNKGIESVGGGVLGGLITMLLVPKISVIGTIILMVVVLLGGIVFITEKSIVEPLEKRSKRVYDNAKNDLDRHRDAKKKASTYYENAANRKETVSESRGASEDRTYYQPSIDEVSHNTDVSSKKVSARRFKNRKKADEEIKSTSNGTIFFDTANRERMSKISEFVVTISGDDNKPVKPDNAPQDWYVDVTDILPESTDSKKKKSDVKSSSDSDIKKPQTDVHYASDNTYSIVKDKPSTKNDFDTLYNNVGYEEDVYEDILATDTGRTDDIRKVVTSTGRVIEKEIDPTVDPIAEKRKAAQEAANRQDTDNVHTVSGTYSARRDSKDIGQHIQSGQKTAAVKSTDTSEPAFTMNKPVKPVKPYKKPPINILARGSGKSGAMTKAELDSTALKLEQTLRDFGVGVTVTDYSCGPAVTRYELQPDHGVKVSRIVNLADDIKLNLAAADIRIEAPIPGKSAVGIEVPNTENSTVYFRNVIESNEFCNYPSNLAFAVGKDIAGNNIIADLARMPHLLIAGATGSGKSVCINTLIMSIIYKTTPEDVQLIMIDPKVVELSVYNGIPHLGGREVVTDPKLAAGALNWAVAEMTDRYKRFAEYNVRNLKGYNEKAEELKAQGEEVDKLPQIVIIVDELADLMMVSAKEVEDSICRLAQLARAAGIHLVIATQRPSVNVITGLIKANIPSRIAFAVSSGVDSRTIIDMNGAEKLLGRGDMLFYPSGYQKPVRVQGAFVSDQEVAKVVEYLRERNSVVESDRSFSEELNRHVTSNKDLQNSKTSESQYDEYFEKAGRFIIEKDKASIGMLQRVFKIGFNRAGRIMDQLAEVGVVGEEEGTKPRKVLMSMEQFENFIEEYL